MRIIRSVTICRVSVSPAGRKAGSGAIDSLLSHSIMDTNGAFACAAA